MSTLYVNNISSQSGSTVSVNTNLAVAGNMVVTGTLRAKLTDFVVQADVTTLGDASGDTVNISGSLVLSGSAKIGQDAKDKHQFTGSIYAVNDTFSIVAGAMGGANISGSGNLSLGGGVTAAGSSVFGDNAGDQHSFTGSVYVSQNLSASSNLSVGGASKIGDSAGDTHQITGSVTFASLASGTLGGDGSYLGLNSANKLVLTSSGGGGTITALNSPTANELVTVGATTTELDAETNLTFDGAVLTVTGSVAVSSSIEFSHRDHRFFKNPAALGGMIVSLTSAQVPKLFMQEDLDLPHAPVKSSYDGYGGFSVIPMLKASGSAQFDLTSVGAGAFNFDHHAIGMGIDANSSSFTIHQLVEPTERALHPTFGAYLTYPSTGSKNFFQILGKSPYGVAKDECYVGFSPGEAAIFLSGSPDIGREFKSTGFGAFTPYVYHGTFRVGHTSTGSAWGSVHQTDYAPPWGYSASAPYTQPYNLIVAVKQNALDNMPGGGVMVSGSNYGLQVTGSARFSEHVYVAPDKKIYFGDATAEHCTIEFDADGTEVLRFSGDGSYVKFEPPVSFDGDVVLGLTNTDATTLTGQVTASTGILVKDDKKVVFGDGSDAYVLYNSASSGLADSFLVISGSVAGVHLSGSTIKLDDVITIGSSSLGRDTVNIHGRTGGQGPGAGETNSRAVLAVTGALWVSSSGGEQLRMGTDNEFYVPATYGPQIYLGHNKAQGVAYLNINDTLTELRGSPLNLVGQATPDQFNSTGFTYGMIGVGGGGVMIEAAAYAIAHAGPFGALDIHMSGGTGGTAVGNPNNLPSIVGVVPNYDGDGRTYTRWTTAGAGGLDNVGTGEIVYFGTGSTEQGYLYYLNSNGAWDKANANATGSVGATGAGNASMLGIALGHTASLDGMLVRGYYNVQSAWSGSWVTGSAVYIASGSAAGKFTGSAPAATDSYVRVLGYCLPNERAIYFNPDKSWVEIS